jgi:hypothetical protein
VGTLKNYSEVWFNKDVITNILSLSRVKERYPAKYDSDEGKQFVAVQPNKEVVFKQSQSGLYYHNTEDCAIIMVEENHDGYTWRELAKAKETRWAMGVAGYPSQKDFKNMVRLNIVRNCPVMPNDINTADNIFGPNVASLKGKTIRNTQEPVLTEYVEIPKEILDLNKDVTLTADVMFVDGLGFLNTASRKIKFATSKYVPKSNKAVLVNSLKKCVDIYTQWGFTIRMVSMNREFEYLCGGIRGVTLDTTAAIEHVPGIKCQICVIKKRAREIRSTLPFDKIPNRTIVKLVNFVVLWFNVFPPSSGVSDTYSPRTIMTGTAIYYKNISSCLSAYVETHEEHTQRNTMAERTRGAICLGPTANFKGVTNSSAWKQGGESPGNNSRKYRCQPRS